MIEDHCQAGENYFRFNSWEEVSEYFHWYQSKISNKLSLGQTYIESDRITWVFTQTLPKDLLKLKSAGEFCYSSNLVEISKVLRSVRVPEGRIPVVISGWDHSYLLYETLLVVPEGHLGMILPENSQIRIQGRQLWANQTLYSFRTQEELKLLKRDDIYSAGSFDRD